MTKLCRHNLEYVRTIGYIKDQLDDGNTLSQELLSILNFENGQFYTLLFAEADLLRMYEFDYGGILQQNKVHEQINKSGSKNYFSGTPSVKNELSNFILEQLRLNNCYSYIFEDVLHTPDMSHNDFFDRYGLLYLNEVYYYLDNFNASQELILSAINNSNAVWHQLFILSEYKKPEAASKEISLEMIKNICKKSQLLVVRAYDGEGYVLWEPNVTKK